MKTIIRRVSIRLWALFLVLLWGSVFSACLKELLDGISPNEDSLETWAILLPVGLMMAISGRAIWGLSKVALFRYQGISDLGETIAITAIVGLFPLFFAFTGGFFYFPFAIIGLILYLVVVGLHGGLYFFCARNAALFKAAQPGDSPRNDVPCVTGQQPEAEN